MGNESIVGFVFCRSNLQAFKIRFLHYTSKDVMIYLILQIRKSQWAVVLTEHRVGE